MPALDDVVVEHTAHAALFALAVGAVQVVDQGAEHGGVGHLAGNGAGFHLGAAQIAAQFRGQRLFDLSDELGSLVVEHLGFAKRLDRLVLGISESGVHDRQHAGHG